MFMVRVRWSRVEDVRGLGCGTFVLLGTFGVGMLGRWVLGGGGVSRVGSWHGEESEAVRLRLRSRTCAACAWWLGSLLWVCLVCRGRLCVMGAGGEY